MTNPSPLSTQVFQILLSLVDHDLHGYAIIQDIVERTDNEVRLTASTLYAAVKRLLDQGLIDEVRSRSRDDDPRRRYYRLTPAGAGVLASQRNTWREFSEAINRITGVDHA